MTLIYGLPVFIAYGTVFKASLLYYLGLVLTIIPFLIIPAGIGIIVTMLLVNAFPARRAKDILVLLGLLFFVVMYILFRMLKPEKLVDPDTFPSLVQYLTALRAPVSPLLPSSWATETLSPLLRQAKGDAVFYLLMLWSTARRRHRDRRMGLREDLLRGLVPLAGRQKGRHLAFTRGGRFFQAVSLPFRGKMRAIVLKDVKLFFRDTSQWSQLFLLFALMVVYIYSFKLLPLERAAMPSFLSPEPDLLPEPRHGGVRDLRRCRAVRVPRREPRRQLRSGSSGPPRSRSRISSGQNSGAACSPSSCLPKS